MDIIFGGGTRKKIAIGLGTGFGGILLACVVLFLHQRRKRINSTSAGSNSWTNSSDCSSLKQDVERGSMSLLAPIFTYNELEEATNNFDPSEEIGDGGFGAVYHGELLISCVPFINSLIASLDMLMMIVCITTCMLQPGKLQDGRHVAVKRLYKNNYKHIEKFINEVTILSRLRHPNLVALYGCTSRHSPQLLLVYEFVPNSTVADHVYGERAKAGLLTWPLRMTIAIETADALAYLHASDTIHRDVKTTNILLDKHFHVKVADFGLSRRFPRNATHVSTAPQGTPGYVDPEYHLYYQLNDKSDVYSFGVVLIELISSKPAVDITRHRHEINLANMAMTKILNHALHELVDPCLGFDSDFTVRTTMTLVSELAFRCLQQERELRPSMMEVVESLRDIKNHGMQLINPEAEVLITLHHHFHQVLLKTMPIFMLRLHLQLGVADLIPLTLLFITWLSL
ncbi:hypothetical protein Sjap_024944 [Stephania japonica]|uniref:Protein kinase domain-containing protein n=1 Tax=Stephania japonica TaxID=461633 RepID=A0AAP0HP79_9MAGN